MSKAWEVYALHILDTFEKILRIQSRGDFRSDEVLYDAILRNLQTLSEATQRLPEEQKSRYGAIPWRNIAGFRNILVHEYLGEIDPEAIRKVLQEHLPPMIDAVRRMVDEGDQRVPGETGASHEPGADNSSETP